MSDQSPEKTRLIRRRPEEDGTPIGRAARSDGGGEETVLDESFRIPGRSESRDVDDQTTRVTPKAPEPDRTQLVAPGGIASPTDSNATRSAVADLPVGCLLVTSGPGTGRVCPVGVGHNTIGRGKDNRVVLDFGDSTISSNRALSLFYEPKRNQFFVAPGEGSNLAYLGKGERAVMEVTEINGGEEILLGKTTLKFFPFCDSAWVWPCLKSESP